MEKKWIILSISQPLPKKSIFITFLTKFYSVRQLSLLPQNFHQYYVFFYSFVKFSNISLLSPVFLSTPPSHLFSFLSFYHPTIYLYQQKKGSAANLKRSCRFPYERLRVEARNVAKVIPLILWVLPHKWEHLHSQKV